MKDAALRLAGGMLYPFVHGYMSAKYLKKMHVSRYQGYITLLYARAEATPVVMPVADVLKMDRVALGAWFHSEVARLNRKEVIPQLDRFEQAAQRAQELAHGEIVVSSAAVPRFIPVPAGA